MRRAGSVLAIALLALVAAGCSRQGASGTSTGELRIGLPINPSTLNGILAENTSETFVNGLIYSQLVTLDDRGAEVPDLAREVPTLGNGGISKDGLTITYHLRRGVKWHDGAPFSSKDVAFTWKAVMDPRNNVGTRHGFDQVASVVTPDPYTVVFRMKRIFPPAIEALFGLSDSPLFVLPEHLLAKYANLNQIPFNAAPVGTGPFAFARWDRGNRIVLTANKAYFRGAPKLKRVVLAIIPDANTVEQELKSHDIDLAFELTGTNFHDFAGDPSFVSTLARSPSFTAIVFNTTHPPLDDPRVRHAIDAAIDRPSIAKNDTYGTGDLAVGPLSRFYWAFDDALAPTPYDPKRAAELLDAAGWRAGPNGVREKDGKPFDLQLVYGQGSGTSKLVVAQVQQMLRAVGLPITLRSYDFATLYNTAQSGGILLGGKFDMTLYSWVAGGDPDDSSQWMSAMIPPAGNNISRYRSPAEDAAQALALSTFDRSVRKRAYARAERQILADAPASFFYYQRERNVASPALHGFAPNGMNDAWNAYAWSI